eukprot:Seg4816.3 transcript_id=Seg4816.3/GoldUCD/mRNA.D3Y31 product="Retrovirus-related Pol polyprotein from type-1 retrotransposable element R2" protein_id=Seg4816.3/GoldUCD/D3Y31
MGRTTLIHKGGPEEEEANYRPIASLNTAYKAMTAVVARDLGEHCVLEDVLPVEQRSMQKGAWGTIDCLLMDESATKLAKARNQRLSTAWIDYRKDFDMVPHGHLKMVLRTIGAPMYIRKFIDTVIPLWKTRFRLTHGKRQIVTRALPLKRGLFQGDALSPLLFCLAIAPMSSALNNDEWNKPYALSDNTTITHLFYMEDLKLFAPNRANLHRGLNLVHEASAAIGMQLGLKKCAMAHLGTGGRKGGQSIDLELPFRGIESFGETETYQYLGVDQLMGIDKEANTKRVTTKIKAELKSLVQKDLNS